jgi:predicted PurR-regulated permease PerM
MTPRTPQDRIAGPRQEIRPAGSSALVTLAVIAGVVASLYFGREIFVPLALAMLLSFALAPPVRWLHRLRIPKVPAVLAVVVLAFLVIVAFGWVVAWQVADLAQRLPAYQQNIEAKIEALRETPPGGSLFERATEMMEDLGHKMEEEAQEAAAESQSPAGADAPVQETEPIPVEVHEPDPTPMELLRTIVGPLIGPLATAGIVVVFVIFMLLKREDLRDRFIRLAGSRDLPRTTQALNDAAWRVGQYLLMQLVVNTTYGIPIGIGLWLIGIPNPILWGMLCTVLRFVPYIGPLIAAFFPLLLAVAVDPGWTTLLWAGALFIVIELISNNFIEPWLYGSSTGLSPVAVIAAAVFWTWLWGPIGLLLSTPLTVCLVVLGRHVPQLGFLDVLLGSDPVLSLPEQLYRQLLVGDADEATERAEEFLRERPLAAFYDEVAIPALALAEHDRVRGSLDEEQRVRVTESAMLLIENLAEWEDVQPVDGGKEEIDPDISVLAASPGPLAADGRIVLCAGARGGFDDAAAAMLAQLLERSGAGVRLELHSALQSTRLRDLDTTDVATLVLSYMNPDSLAHARFLVRRLRRRLPDAAIIVGFWTFPPEEMARRDPVAATRADRLATSLTDAFRDVIEQLSPEAPLDAAPEPRLAVAADR